MSQFVWVIRFAQGESSKEVPKLIRSLKQKGVAGATLGQLSVLGQLWGLRPNLGVDHQFEDRRSRARGDL